jgi:hypothetical protein
LHGDGVSKLRKSARGMDCMIRIPGACNFNQESTVLAHMNGAGMGLKHPDLFASFACSNCHDVIDGRRPYKEASKMEVDIMFLHGMLRTQKYWLDNGFITIK